MNLNPKELRKLAKKVMSSRVAGRNSDPRFYSGLSILPNPDPILRSMGQAEKAYDDILSDAHVLGEVRAIRADILGASRRIKLPEGKWADNSKEAAARDLCALWMKKKPNHMMTWDDIIWSMFKSVLCGYRGHEMEWLYRNTGHLLPNLYDVPNRRFKFDAQSYPRLLTKENAQDGIEVSPEQFVFTRHMASTENPYGRAILSSCFWPYTFKHGGFKFFYEFCERFGLPFPVGKYPAGTDVAQQQELADALVQMVEEGIAVIPDGSSVELLETKTSGGGNLPQEALVALCNKEMSKALTSQTLAMDIEGAGSYGAAESHKERGQGVSAADRRIIEASMNEILALITKYNFGDDVIPPVFEFHKEAKPTKERAEIYEIASRIANPSKQAFLDEMNIPMAEGDDDLLAAPQPTLPPANFSAHHSPMNFNNGQSLESAAIDAADEAIERDYINPVVAMLKEYEEQGKTLKEFKDDMPKLFDFMDDEQLQQVNRTVLQYAFGEGMSEEP